MTRDQLDLWILKQYGIPGERPWMRYPSFRVYRHTSNKKWFAVIMTIPKMRLGIAEEGSIDVVNFKCDEAMTNFLWEQRGICPAYHMNKRHWITVLLDGTVNTDTVKNLCEISFNLTEVKQAKI